MTADGVERAGGTFPNGATSVPREGEWDNDTREAEKIRLVATSS
jgi:hypothetical protein